MKSTAEQKGRLEMVAQNKRRKDELSRQKRMTPFTDKDVSELPAARYVRFTFTMEKGLAYFHFFCSSA
jgi:hypothetical protein